MLEVKSRAERRHMSGREVSGRGETVYPPMGAVIHRQERIAVTGCITQSRCSKQDRLLTVLTMRERLTRRT